MLFRSFKWTSVNLLKLSASTIISSSSFCDSCASMARMRRLTILISSNEYPKLLRNSEVKLSELSFACFSNPKSLSKVIFWSLCKNLSSQYRGYMPRQQEVANHFCPCQVFLPNLQLARSGSSRQNDSAKFLALLLL